MTLNLDTFRQAKIRCNYQSAMMSYIFLHEYSMKFDKKNNDLALLILCTYVTLISL